jgi:hypothetical protein
MAATLTLPTDTIIDELLARSGMPQLVQLVAGEDAARRPLAPHAVSRKQPAGQDEAVGEMTGSGLLAFTLEQFERAGRALEVRVPWCPEPLWFVPSHQHAAALERDGLSRGRIWTAGELGDLLSVPGITKEPARTVAVAKLEFQGEVVETMPAPAAAAPHSEGCDCRQCIPPTGQAPGPKTLGAFACCSACGVGCWTRFGRLMLCSRCAERSLA